MAIDMSQFYEVFFEETGHSLMAIEAALTSIDPVLPDHEALKAAHIAAHAIKGSSGTFGFDEMARVAAALEDVLDRFLEGAAAPSRRAVDLCLQSCRVLRGNLDAQASGANGDAEAARQMSEHLRGLVPTTEVGTRAMRARRDAGGHPVSEDDRDGAYGFFGTEASNPLDGARIAADRANLLQDRLARLREGMRSVQGSLRQIEEVAGVIDELAAQAGGATSVARHPRPGRRGGVAPDAPAARMKSLAERAGAAGARLRALVAASGAGLEEAVDMVETSECVLAASVSGLRAFEVRMAGLWEAFDAHRASFARVEGLVMGRPSGTPPGDPAAGVCAAESAGGTGALIEEMRALEDIMRRYAARQCERLQPWVTDCGEACALRAWLGARSEKPGGDPIHAKIIDSHALLHACARKVDTLAQAGSFEQARRLVEGEFLPIVATITAQLAEAGALRIASVARGSAVAPARRRRAGVTPAAPLPKVGKRTTKAAASQTEWEAF